MNPGLAKARSLSVQQVFFTDMDTSTFNDSWEGVLNPQKQQAKAEEQQQLEKQQEASLLDTAKQGYSDMKAAEMLDLNRQYQEAIPKLEQDVKNAGPMTRWLYDATLEDSKKSLQETQDWLVQYEADKKNRAINPTLEKIQQSKTFGDAWDAFKEHPIDAIAYGSASSAIPSALMVGNAYLGNRVGGTTGAMVAGGASSADMEYKSGVMEALSAAGVDVSDRQALDKALKKPELMSKIDLQAGQKAAVVGALDAASLGVAGALFPSSPIKSTLANALVAQPALGAGGEALGSVYSGQEIKPGAVALEALGEVPGAAIEVAMMRKGDKPITRRDSVIDATTITPQPIQPDVNPLSQFVQQAPQPQAANQANQQALLPSKAQPHPDDIYYVDQAGRAQYGNPNVQRSFGGDGLTEQAVRGRSIGDLIASGEGDYQSFNRGKAGDSAGEKIDFSQMTVAELMQRQALPIGNPDRIFTVGKYQAIPETFAEAVQKLGIPADTKVTPALQEYIFSEYLLKDKRPDIRDYITGKSDNLKNAQKAGAMEWAAVADPDTGLSFHGKVGNNKASIRADAFGSSLGAIRQAYADAVSQGANPDEAWSRAVNGASSATPLPTVRTSTGFQRTATEQPKDNIVSASASNQLSMPQEMPVENKLPKAEIYDAQNNKYNAQYEVVDAAALVPTIEKADNQYRDRNRTESQRQIDSIATDPNYGRLNMLHSTFTDGAPVLQQDNTILAGNGRIAGLKKAYDAGSAENYKRSLISDLSSKGIDTVPIEQMQSPILVRRLTDEVDTKKVSVLSNVGSGMAMSPSEQAIIDAGYIQSLHGFTPDDTGDITFQSASGLFKRLAKAVPTTERNSILTDENKVGADGVKRVKNALLYMAYGDSPALRQMTESGTPDHVNVTKALVKAAPVLAELRDNIRQGISHDVDLTPAIIDSFALFSQIKKDPNNTIESWLNQQDAFSQVKPEVKVLIRRLDAATRRPNQLADFLVSYAQQFPLPLNQQYNHVLVKVSTVQPNAQKTPYCPYFR